MRNKFIALGIVAAMVMAGCGSQQKANDGSAPASSSATVGENTTAVAGTNATSVAGSNETMPLGGENTTAIAGENETVVSGEEDLSSEEDVSEEEAAAEAEREALLAIPTVSGEFKLEDCVKIGDYKGLDLHKHVYEVTDEDVDMYLSYQMYPEEIDDEDAEVKTGDIATIDYVGTIDGEEFDGGSSTDYDLEIGSETFIPGFEDGIIGMKKGETKDLELTFPDEYVEDLAGKDVTFKVTLKAIKQMPELTDEWVKNNPNTEAQTVDEFKEEAREFLKTQNELESENTMKGEAWAQVLDSTEILAFPEEYLQTSLDEFDASIKEEAELSGVSVDEYIESIGMTKEEMDEYFEVSSRGNVKTRLIAEAINEAEGLTEESPEYAKALASLEATFGLPEDEIRKEYGDNMFDNYLLSEMAMQFIIDNANITEVQGDEEPSESIVEEDTSENAGEDTEAETDAESAVSGDLASEE